MSKEVDQRVVEMRFDNSHFEQNVKTSMSTLDRLKKALNLDGATKGLQNVGDAASKVNMNPLSGAIETVSVKFSALEVMAVTALSNITNSAVNAGKQLAKSLSIDQVSAGWDKYAQKTANVQTLVNSTGKTVEEINAYLDKLMWYSDETSYGFTDMTQALSTMTSSGGDIEKLIPLIMGVANATAFAGKGASDFSRIMQYSVNQAYSTGYMQVQDWKTIESATVNSKQLQQELIKAAEDLGKIEKGSITLQNFRSSLKDAWLDTEVMEQGFGYFAKVSNEIYTGVQNGTFENYADGLEKIGEKYGTVALRAAASSQEAKTFTEAIDATKDAVSSGWMKTFELIFGTYDKAKELWTGFSEWLWDIFASGGEKRNEIIEEALSMNPYTNLIEKLKNVTDSVKTVTDKLKEYEEIVNRIINGDFGNGQERWDKLTEAGYDWAHAQNLVNEKLGSTVRHATEYSETQEGLTETTIELTDAKLKELGLTDEEIKMYRSLEEQSKATGKSINELVNEMSQETGRDLLIQSFQNIGDNITTIINAIKEAWSEVFEFDSVKLYNMIKGFKELTDRLKLNEEAANKLKITFKGLFSILRLIVNIIKGSIKIAFNLISKLFGESDKSVLDFTASVGESLIEFEKWISSNETLAKVINGVVSVLGKVITKIREAIIWVKDLLVQLYNLPVVQKAITSLKDVCVDFANTAGTWFSSLGDKISGLITKFKSLITSFLGGSEEVAEETENLEEDNTGTTTKKISGTFGSYASGNTQNLTYVAGSLKGVSTNINGVSTTVNGVKNSIITLGNTASEKLPETVKSFESFSSKVKTILTNLKNWISENVGFGEIFTVVLGGTALIAIKKIFDIVNLFKSPLKTVDDLVANLSDGVTSLVNALAKDKSADAFLKRSEAIFNFAKSVGIMVIALFALTKIDFDKLGKAAHILGILTLSLVGVYVIFALIGKFTGTAMGNLPIVSLITALVSIVTALKSMEDMDPLKTILNTILLIKMLIVLAGISIALSKLAPQLSKGAVLFVGIGIALKLMVGCLKTLNEMDLAKTITSLFILMKILTTMSACITVMAKLGGENTYKAGIGILAMAASMLLVILAMKMIAKMSDDEIERGLTGLIEICGIFVGLMAATKLAGDGAEKAGKSILAMSAGLILVAIAVKILSEIEESALERATIAVSALMGVMSGCIVLLTRVGGDESKLKGVATTMLAMSVALLLMAAVVVILSHIEGGPLAKAVAALGVMEGLFAGLIVVTKYAKGCEDTLKTMAIVIGILAGSLIILSLLDSTKVAVAAASITAVVGIFALLMYVTQYAKNTKQMVRTLYAMAGVVVVLGGIIAALSLLGVKNALVSAGALSLLLLSLSVSMVIIGNMGSLSTKAHISLGVMLLVVAALGGILMLFKDLKPESTLATAAALSLLLISMSASLILLAVAGLLGSAALIGIGSLLLVIVAIGALLVGIGALVTEFPRLEEFLDKGIPIIEKIAYAMGSIVGNIIKGFASAVLDIIPMIGTKLSEFWTEIQPFIDGVTNLKPETLNGVIMLVKIMLLMAAAELISAISSYLSFLTGGSSLKKFGKELVEFAPCVVDFAKKMSELSPSELIALSMSAQAVKYLCEAADAVPKRGGLVSAITGENSLIEFATELIAFAPSLILYATTMIPFAVGDILLTAVNKSAEAIGAICEVANKVPKHGGLVQSITGDNSLVGFAVELYAMAPSLLSYAIIVTPFAKDDTLLTAVNKSTEAIGAICEVANKVPKHGGFVQAITGDNSLKTFATELDAMAPSLLSYATIVTPFAEDDTLLTAVNKSTEAIGAICEVSDKVPEHGGFVQAITGDNSLKTFATELDAMAPSLSSYAAEVVTITDDEWVAVEKSVDNLGDIVGVAANIPDMGGIKTWFNGDNTLSDFSGELYKMAPDFCKYANHIVDNMPETGYDKITESVTLLKGLVEAANQIPKDSSDSINLKEFAGHLKVLGDGLEDYYNDVKDIETDKLDNIKPKLTDLVNISKSVASENTGNFNTFGDAIAHVGTSLNTYYSTIKNINFEDLAKARAELNGLLLVSYRASEIDISAFNNFGVELGKVGKNSIEKFTDAFKNAKNNVNSAGAKMITDMILFLSSDTTKGMFKTTGKNLVTGFVDGINNGTTSLSKASINLAKTTCDAIKKALDIRSPSRVTYKLGAHTVNGFVNAIYDYADAAEKAGSDMAISASNGLNNSISSIKDFIDGKISSQPTIRPVLDLSDVENGARRIGGMFSAKQALSVATNGYITGQNGNSGYVINMTINGAQGQDVKQLADLVSERINNSVQRRNNTWR